MMVRRRIHASERLTDQECQTGGSTLATKEQELWIWLITCLELQESPDTPSPANSVLDIPPDGMWPQTAVQLERQWQDAIKALIGRFACGAASRIM